MVSSRENLKKSVKLIVEAKMHCNSPSYLLRWSTYHIGVNLKKLAISCVFCWLDAIISMENKIWITTRLFKMILKVLQEVLELRDFEAHVANSELHNYSPLKIV